MKRRLIFSLALLVFMEAVAWLVYEGAKKEAAPMVSQSQYSAGSPAEEEQSREIPLEKFSEEKAYLSEEVREYPLVTLEEKNGRTERTIHIGVRQYVWEPSILLVKKGELVRLIVHNADVQHGLVIPDLGVYQDIPPEGAVIEFTPEKRGIFELFCSVWCGEGHMEMRGKITVE